MSTNNPLLEHWTTPFGLPPFARIGSDHFEPAIEAAMAEHLREIEAIEAYPAEPDFSNTIEALERSGEVLAQVAAVFFNLASAHTNDALQALERVIAPKLAAHGNRVHTSASLFARVDRVFAARDTLGLTAEQLRVLERHHTGFVRAGARLDEAGKARMGEISQALAGLSSRFGQNVLKAEQDWFLDISDEPARAGLPNFLVDAAAEAARDKGGTASHAITMARSLIEPFLQFSARRDLREAAWRAWSGRGEGDGEADNRPVAAEMLALRRELAGLLGFESYAAFKLDDVMAKTPDAVRRLLMDVWQPARQRALEDRGVLEEMARGEGMNELFAPWDWRFFAEKLRRQKFDLDEAATKPFLALDQVIAAAFDCAIRLFGLRFEEKHGLELYHPDVRAFEVSDADGRHLGLFLGDYFARSSKRSGAWASRFRGQQKLRGEIRPIIVNVMNFARGTPPLLTFDDARTLFHEFGHGLHGLLSDVTYPSIAGTQVARDFVELPSQLYEHWLAQKPVLQRFARHHKTGEPMPDALIDKLLRARTFNQGFAAVEFIGSALIDLELHEKAQGGDAGELQRIERAMVEAIGMPPEIGMRHRLPHFQHVFSGGYAAGYYSYLWSEVMDADAFGAFEEAGDIFDDKTADLLHRYIYSAGGRQDPADAYVAFRGRMPETAALLARRGLA